MKTFCLNNKNYAFDFTSIEEAKEFSNINNGKTCVVSENWDDEQVHFFEFCGYSEKGVADLRGVDGSNLIYEDRDEWESKEQFMSEMNEEYYGSQFLEEIWNAMEEKKEVTHTVDTLVDIEYLPKLYKYFFAVEYER